MLLDSQGTGRQDRVRARVCGHLGHTCSLHILMCNQSAAPGETRENPQVGGRWESADGTVSGGGQARPNRPFPEQSPKPSRLGRVGSVRVAPR